MRKIKLMELLGQPFRKPTPLQLIAQELADAHLELLTAESGVEYAESIVSYNKARITRLNSRLDMYKTYDATSGK
jgi:hypothetical protein